MYVHGIVRNGVRGVHLDYEDVVQGDENREEYGIDWEDMDRPMIRNHHDTFNPSLPAENLNGVNRDIGNPFTVNHPDRLSQRITLYCIMISPMSTTKPRVPSRFDFEQIRNCVGMDRMVI